MPINDINVIFNQIYEETNKKVIFYITAKCGKVEDIQDIFQNTYMEIMDVLVKNGGSYIQNKEAFVIHIAKQKIHQHYSFIEHMKNKLHFILDSQEPGIDDVIEICSEDNISLEDQVLQSLLLNEINELIVKKSQLIQKIFFLYYDMDYTIIQIARLLNLSESNVKNKLYRTLKQIRGLYR